MTKYYLTEISKLLDISQSAIRYYDDKGLFPRMQRDNNNRRYATEEGLEHIRTILCLKDTGMNLVDIKHYLDLVQLGDSSLEERFQMILKQEKNVLKKERELAAQKDFINYKKQFYKDKIANSK
ncbi:hypothetical protein SCULI_v1c10190 [Spiroplasma culicicola AES-1]|uniref:HTH merR-type domain-containing protein n=2 Tax=Spiroplasma culicicola TaxID=216935 RepID=W6AI30_9MOLU|nr:hypothetical protein SCULI_v1c10190 [Spiroplasma culicicola AES-1]